MPQLRNLADRVGMELKSTESLAGFGFTQDGSIPSLSMFMNSFDTQSDQEVADLIAFVLSIPGSELPGGSSDAAFLEPPGPSSQDTHAAVGAQITFDPGNFDDPGLLARLELLADLAEESKIGLIAKGRLSGLVRGYRFAGSGVLESDRSGETTTLGALRGGVVAGGEVTFTAVPAGNEERLGVDRDGDGFPDRDELDQCADPANAGSVPVPGCIFLDDLESGDASRWAQPPGG